MAKMYFDDTNKVTLPSDGGYLKAKGDKISDAYINAQSNMSTPKFKFGGKTETCDVKFCTANANKTIDMQNGYMWFYLQASDSRSEGAYIYQSIDAVIASAKKRVALTKSGKNAWAGKVYIYSRDAATKEEFLVATVEATKSIRWIPNEKKGANK